MPAGDSCARWHIRTRTGSPARGGLAARPFRPGRLEEPLERFLHDALVAGEAPAPLEGPKLPEGFPQERP